MFTVPRLLRCDDLAGHISTTDHPPCFHVNGDKPDWTTSVAILLKLSRFYGTNSDEEIVCVMRMSFVLCSDVHKRKLLIVACDGVCRK